MCPQNRCSELCQWDNRARRQCYNRRGLHRSFTEIIPRVVATFSVSMILTTDYHNLALTNSYIDRRIRTLAMHGKTSHEKPCALPEN